ncbi:MAG: 4Fe-4S dicluster domain-containing protein [Bilophila wadsworthia]
MHCDHPLCVEACPTHATYKADDGSVGIDPERCIGCGGCIEACPYGARYKHPVTGRADKCDYCRRATPGQVPAGVQVCPVRCRVFGDADNPDDPVARALAGNRHVYVVPPDFD